MKYNPKKHHRRSIRLQGYDYASPGAYFVTVCVQGRECRLGEVVDGEMQLNASGEIAAQSWLWLGKRYPYVAVDQWVVMPNHTHAIIVIDNDAEDTRIAASRDPRTGIPRTGIPRMGIPGTGDPRILRTGGSRTAPSAAAAPARRKPLGRLVGAFKTVSTKRINLLRDTPGERFWKRNYWEHVIRDDASLQNIRRYIKNNPARWEEDQLHPHARPNPFNRG